PPPELGNVVPPPELGNVVPPPELGNVVPPVGGTIPELVGMAGPEELPPADPVEEIPEGSPLDENTGGVWALEKLESEVTPEPGDPLPDTALDTEPLESPADPTVEDDDNGKEDSTDSETPDIEETNEEEDVPDEDEDEELEEELDDELLLDPAGPPAIPPPISNLSLTPGSGNNKRGSAGPSSNRKRGT
ncbi:MAG: hypothetical protein AAF532_02785, partial [Planctomycetota bacterium]